MDFYGTYEHKIDGKGRLVLPSTFRSAFADGGMAAMIEDYAALFTHEGWEAYRRKLEGAGHFDREELRWLFSLASAFEPDTQNRITLPLKLRQHTGLEEEISVIGSVRYIALFPRAEWARREAEVRRPSHGPSVAEKFRSLEFL